MMLTLSGLHTHYGHIHALRGVDVEVGLGEIITLIGANGAGKSTLMMTIFGNPRASGGRVVFEGQDITALPTHHIAHRGIALVPEGRHIYPRMTVLENLQIGAVRADAANFESDVARMIELFPILGERRAQRAGTLSGGEQQMLAIGMTILLVEQNANHALKVAHRAYVMQHGQIVLSGSGAELLASPEVRAAYLEGGH